VNFLLHHHLAIRDLGAPAAGAGAMLPDLWRMADRRVFARDVDPQDEPKAVREALDGIVHHEDADRWFHEAPVFAEGERATRDALRTTHAPRIGLFAHIAWELCLDGALVRRVGLAEVLDAIRAALQAIRDAHDRAADLHHFARVDRTADDRAAFDARMKLIFDELSRGPWIAGYADGEGVAARLERVRARLRFPAFEDRSAIAAALDTLCARADEAVATIVTAPRFAAPAP
jgi:hypothetical protein